MKLKTLFALAIITLTTTLAMAEEDWGVYEYTDPEEAVHWINLTINGEKVSGDITKYLSDEMKEKLSEEKFTGKVISGLGTSKLKLEIAFKSKPTEMGDVGNVRINKNGKSIWKIELNNRLIVPMFYYIGQGHEENSAFGYVSPN